MGRREFGVGHGSRSLAERVETMTSVFVIIVITALEIHRVYGGVGEHGLLKEHCYEEWGGSRGRGRRDLM